MKDGKPDTDALIMLREQVNSVGLKTFGGGIFYAREGNFFDESIRKSRSKDRPLSRLQHFEGPCQFAIPKPRWADAL